MLVDHVSPAPYSRKLRSRRDSSVGCRLGGCNLGYWATLRMVSWFRRDTPTCTCLFTLIMILPHCRLHVIQVGCCPKCFLPSLQPSLLHVAGSDFTTNIQHRQHNEESHCHCCVHHRLPNTCEDHQWCWCSNRHIRDLPVLPG